MKDGKCSECLFYHRLKHNFIKGKGYIESKCCTVWVDYDLEHPDTIKSSFVLEVHPDDFCEMFQRRD